MDKVIRISLRFESRRHLAVLMTIVILLVVSLVSFWAQQRRTMAMNQPIDTQSMAQWLRRFYLTTSSHNGADAAGTDGNGAGVCAPGYHFASLWEIQDISGLRYDNAYGIERGDSYHGPPSGYLGWVRTGSDSSSDAVAGEANCLTWSESGESSGESHFGTAIQLPTNWSIGISQNPWQAEATDCASALPVWCLADNVGSIIYLPLVER